MENNIVLTMKEQKRIEIIERVFRKEITMVEAAMVLGVSERQCYRIKAGVKKEGAKGVVHGNRGRACKKKLSEKTEGQIVKLAQGKYRGFNDHHLTEKLKDEEKIELSREKVRQILTPLSQLASIIANFSKVRARQGRVNTRGEI